MTLIELINLVAAVLLGGLLTFLATQLVKRVSWPTWLKLILSLVMAALFALATAWVNGDVWVIVNGWGSLTAETVFAFFGLIWTTATVWYKLVFKGTNWAQALGEFPKT